MKNLLTLCMFLITSLGFSQNLTLTSPSGLSEPYEVAYGTVVTVEWDYFESEPTYMFTYDQFPGSDLNTDWQFFINTDWNSGSGWYDNGDGTYSWDVTINEDTWIFGAYNTFNGNSYSNVIQVSVASDVVISFEDGAICSSGGSENLSVEGTYSTYQWYQDGILIDGATTSLYTATSAGTYYVIADGVQSNVLTIQNLSISFTGAINVDGTVLTLSADEGMDTYQWYSGTDESSMTAISGANSSVYVATLGTDLTYYHVVATLDLCEVVSDNRSANLDMFVAPVLTVNADTNEYNHVCVGTPITLSIAENTENFTWYRNDYSTYFTTTSVVINNIFSTGVYYVIISIEEWPEIEVQSNSINTSYYELISPVLFGVTNYELHCIGEDITIDLSDEGYNYYWYVHEGYTYNDTDLVEGITTSYSFTFEDAIRITVVGEFQGCQTSSTLVLNSYADQSIYVSPSNFNQQYLCTDSVANLYLSDFTASNYTDFQWLNKNGSIWEEITGATTNIYAAADSGYYKLRATSIDCPSVIIESNEYHVKHYSERSLNLYVDQTEMCLGDSATLNIYSTSWTAIQWHKGDIQMGSSGYELFYVPISGAGNLASQKVYEFNTYIVKAKHNSCPNGLKISSNPKQVKPSLNPEVIFDLDVESYELALWDSAIFYLSCQGADVNLSVEDIYDTYQWYDQIYAGLDDYAIPGDPISGANSASLNVNVNAQWLTAEVSLDGCIGYTDPILLDSWFFADPVVASYNNNIICDDDSALVNLAFQGPWIEYYWLHIYNGVIDTVPNSNNDSIWVTEPGEYIIFAYPEQCPTALSTSGQGPYMDYLEAIILEATDVDGTEFFYASPWQGFFDYQWFIDGEPYENPAEVPYVILKEGLPAGEITVEITSLPDGCTDLSDAVIWDPSVGISELYSLDLNIYPNPSQGMISISGIESSEIASLVFYNTQGQKMKELNVIENMQGIDISDFPKGIYVLRIFDIHGNMYAESINKL